VHEKGGQCPHLVISGREVQLMARYAMVTDLKKCVGCQACTVACNSEWEVPAGFARTHVRYTGVAGTFPDLVSSFYVAQCNHCDRPACLEPCPTGATYQAENGIVKVDRDLCIGCGYCVEACPYEARYINPISKKVDKCDFCSARIARGQEPACVETCTAHAKFFGDLEDPSSEVYKLVYEKGARRLETAEVAIGPNVYYLGKEESIDLVLSSFPPHRPRLIKPGEVWSKVLKPLVLAAIGATFLGQAVAFFHQLKTGEKEFED
jgi:tetrathionate reductase subunit B